MNGAHNKKESAAQNAPYQQLSILKSGKFPKSKIVTNSRQFKNKPISVSC